MTTTVNRYLELDALRGFAVMGILAINIAVFAQSDSAFVSPLSTLQHGPADMAAWIGSFILFDGKMRGLFSLLFGASTALVIERAMQSGQSAAKVHFSRMFWLALFGLAHFYFIWWGDILFLYAATGCVLFLMRSWTAQKLLLWGCIGYVFGTLFLITGLSTMLYVQIQAQAANASTEEIVELGKILTDLAMSPEDVADQVALYRSSYGEILFEKLNERTFMPVKNLIISPFETLPLMMIGMGLYKNGFILGQWEKARYVRIGVWATILGLIGTIAVTVFAVFAEYDAIWMMNIATGWAALPRLPMIIGYSALLLLLIQAFAGNHLIHRVAAAGRAAFSNYLGTSVLMAFIFYGWGLGYYGDFGRAALCLFVLGTWALMLLWSKPWLIRFRYGPLEWLWRSLARGEVQSMRLTA